MEFRTIRAFVEVVRQGGFSRAAETVFATQSAVSKAVRQLEDEVGTPLLDRIGHRAILTAAGEVVYRRGVKLLADRDNLMVELDEIRGLKRGLLRLGLPPVGSGVLLAPVFAAYRQRFPGVEVRLVEHGSDELEESLRAGEIDFAGALLPTLGDFEWEPVRRDPLVALLPVGHPLAGRATLSIAELRDTPFILFESGFALHRIVLNACRKAGFEPHVVARSSQIDFMFELVGAGLGVAFLPRLIATQRRSDMVRGVLVEEPDTAWSFAMAWRRGAYLSEAAKAWLALVREIHGPRQEPAAALPPGATEADHPPGATGADHPQP